MAVGLRRLGCDVTVYERSRGELAGRGLGIGIASPVFPTLTEFLDPDLRGSRLSRRSWFVRDGSPSGRLAWRQQAGFLFTNWGVVWRSLRAKVPDSVYRNGIAIREVRADGTVLTDAGADTFDLVVGADGYRSLCRAVVDPASGLDYAGYVLWRGDLPVARLPASVPGELRSAGVFVLFPGGHGGCYLMPDPAGADDRVNWAVYHALPPDRPDPFADPTSVPPGSLDDDLFAAFEAAVGELPPHWAQVARLTPREGVSVQPIYDAQAARYVAGRVVLAGDAGCLARPHTGSGVLKAIQDAQCLERAYREHGDWDTALARYDAERVRAGRELVLLGRRLGDALVRHTPDWSAMSEDEFGAWYERTYLRPVTSGGTSRS